MCSTQEGDSGETYKYYIISTTYDGIKCYVLHRCEISEEFEGQSEVRQDCILSPTLFLLVIGDVLYATLSGGREGVQRKIISLLKHLDYADYICLFSYRVTDFGQIVLNLGSEASRVGLKIKTR